MYEELRRWLFSGHRGKTGAVGFIIKNKASMINFTKKIHDEVLTNLTKVKSENLPIEYTET